MSVLLDTHSAIWYLHTPNKLSTRALDTIRKSIAQLAPVFLSAISLVETVYLTESGRLPFDAWRFLDEAVKSPRSGILVQPIDEAVAALTRDVPRKSVPDMPDRIIAATALHLGLPLVTRDRRLQAVGIKTIW